MVFALLGTQDFVGGHKDALDRLCAVTLALPALGGAITR